MKKLYKVIINDYSIDVVNEPIEYVENWYHNVLIGTIEDEFRKDNGVDIQARDIIDDLIKVIEKSFYDAFPKLYYDKFLKSAVEWCEFSKNKILDSIKDIYEVISETEDSITFYSKEDNINYLREDIMEIVEDNIEALKNAINSVALESASDFAKSTVTYNGKDYRFYSTQRMFEKTININSSIRVIEVQE